MDATKSFPNPLTVVGAESSVGAGVSWHKNAHVQFITHYNDRCSYVDSARIALEGGCRWVQLRMKDADEVTMEKTALIVQEMCKDYGATFIIDDNVSLVKKIKADGVHLGKKDIVHMNTVLCMLRCPQRI